MISFSQHQIQKIQNNQCIIFTDLDGTLLNHKDYGFGPIPDALNTLRQVNCPVIFNTSKTAAEVIALQDQLNYKAPFIVENGAAVYVPANSFWFDEQVVEVPGAVRRASLFDKLKAVDAKAQQAFGFEAFIDLNPERISDLTGLHLEQAQMANQRAFSEPMVWQDSDANYQAFTKIVHKAGLNLVKGGRFSHLMGRHDKSLAMQHFLKTFYAGDDHKPLVIALGDSQNDKLMLEMSDIACVLPLPNKPHMTINHTNSILAEHQAPKGWVDSIEFIWSQAHMSSNLS